MAQISPENNMAIIANAAELTRLTVASMMSNEAVRNLFGQPSARENVYATVNLAINKRLSADLRAMPGGQFNKSVLTGSHQSGSVHPNVKA